METKNDVRIAISTRKVIKDIIFKKEEWNNIFMNDWLFLKSFYQNKYNDSIVIFNPKIPDY